MHDYHPPQSPEEAEEAAQQLRAAAEIAAYWMPPSRERLYVLNNLLAQAAEFAGSGEGTGACLECGRAFVYDIRRFLAIGAPPRRCIDCRAARKAAGC
jgi:hypothetical protein